MEKKLKKIVYAFDHFFHSIFYVSLAVFFRIVTNTLFVIILLHFQLKILDGIIPNRDRKYPLNIIF